MLCAQSFCLLIQPVPLLICLFSPSLWITLSSPVALSPKTILNDRLEEGITANQKGRSTLAINTQVEKKKKGFQTEQKSLSGKVCSELVANVVCQCMAFIIFI